MKIRHLLVLIVSLSLISCAPKIQLFDQTGRSMPQPSYLLTSESPPIQVIYYFSKIENVIDLDKSLHKQYTFIDPKNVTTFTEGQKVELTIEVLNPTRATYKLFKTVHHDRGSQVSSEAVSNLRYRVITIDIPTEIPGSIKFNLQMFGVDDDPIMLVNHFNYNIRR